jgi:hypothetical protein
MRELHDGHVGRHRHGQDATVDAPGKHARDAPKHEAHASLKLKMLWTQLRARKQSTRGDTTG